MKLFILTYISVFIVLMPLCLNAQKTDSLKPDSVIKTSDLKYEQWKAWDSISDYWLKNEFPQCLKKNNLKLSCSGCESIYLVVNFYIDNDGKLSSYEIVKDKACGKAATHSLKKCFLLYFNNLVFPPLLRNIYLQVYLGNGLKC